jgi:hypothetical protein
LSSNAVAFDSRRQEDNDRVPMIRIICLIIIGGFGIIAYVYVYFKEYKWIARNVPPLMLEWPSASETIL